MELEEGMHVRTKDGYIFKIKELLEKGKYNDSDNKIVQRFKIDGMYQKNDDYIETDYMYSDWVIKASHNIIDLIEVGDYVNGYPVYEIIEYKDNTRAIVIADDNKSIIWEESSQYIKSIVTKEQFEAMKYEIK